jgi:hypothetical protein
MFDPKKWIEKSWDSDDTKMIKVAGEDAKIRRLKGTEWEAYHRAVHGQSNDSSVALVLQYGLVKAFGQYTYDEMVKLYDTCPVVADQIAGQILEFTSQRMNAEKQVLEDAEKNSVTTTTSPPTVDGAENTDKTPGQQE